MAAPELVPEHQLGNDELVELLVVELEAQPGLPQEWSDSLNDVLVDAPLWYAKKLAEIVQRKSRARDGQQPEHIE
jgi:hypothetical protein